MPSTTPALSWDIFCNVIDNYGDIGVTWRLARQLCQEHGQRVRLWVDDLRSFSRLCPDISPNLARQDHRGIEVLHWTTELPADALPGDVVLDAFGCTLPEPFLTAMARCRRPPLWLNLEYLTAEEWIECCHGMVSPHPKYGINRYFFFPGFTARTGGIIAERDIVTQARQWQQDPNNRDLFLQSLGLPPLDPDALIVSLFAYENAAIGELMRFWASGPQPVTCLVPEGRILSDIAAGLARGPLAAGDHAQAGALTLHVLPFSDQDTYDRLLWSCDVNFVRGEDSFMRAQLAGKPMIWHIYPQEDAAHWVKLDAFCTRYLQGVAPEVQQAMLALNHAWNHCQAIVPAWRQFIAKRLELTVHATEWPRALLAGGDLATRLMRFIAAKRDEA
ncbi:MAG: elongation factor P maturation arginine rhamnosyltransferase EarP [Paludibacterium sp.]|uniref:elongation factor P maturation arginine rhamnosyltransferase EarP n=1 Tax=Paludibacterium sp. TaxID=1917523 RepID=UPI0025F9329E|nr:elongation factor P maturation arginine rhamnosyltransferase EarP [Paludibacterium sp.]MBV8046123.1 elongation factor P maturation arginine rhamnosyltransferase EarP [Paludibacterium sp.]MBV8647339.1 elongation factor P maturation arginine rhamnosyltransferase EarP [Paludibacterium sp.]